MNIRIPKLPQWVAVIAILSNVLMIAGPDITAAIPRSAKYVSLATSLLIALARSLGTEGGGNTVSNGALRVLLAFALMPLLLAGTFTMTACGASEMQRVVSRADGVVRIVRSIDPVGQLLAEKLISQEEADGLQSKISDFTNSFSRFDTKLTELVKDNPHANLAEVMPLFVEAITHLDEIGAIHLSNPAASVRLNRILSGVRLGVGFVAAFFASNIARAGDFLDSPRPAAVERALLSFYGVRYDARRLAESRKVLRDSRDNARDRAVCHYFGVSYDPAGLHLLRAFAAEVETSAS